MFDNLDDPKQQALLAMAFGLLGGQGGKGFGGFARDAGQAGLLGLNRYAVANEDKRRSGLVEDQRKMQAMQLAEMQRGQDWQKAMQAGYQAPQAASQTFGPDDMETPGQFTPGRPESFDFAKAMAIDPLKTAQVRQQFNKAEAPLVLSEGQTAFGRDGKPLFNVPKTEKAKFQAGDTREIKSGQRVITQEYDGKEWKTVGQAPLWKPDAPDKAPAAPQGYQWTGDGKQLLPIPGGPADFKRGKEAEATQKRTEGALARADFVLGQVNEAIKESGVTTAGPLGAIGRNIPGTGAYNLNKKLDSIRSNIGFAELQAMREASPTGGALGQVAVQELNMLQSVLGSLDTAQSPGQLEKNLYAIEKHYRNWKQAVKQAGSASSVDALVEQYSGK